MSHFQLNFHGFTFRELFQADSLNTLDQEFLTHLHRDNPLLHENLLAYRKQTQPFTPTQVSEILLACAPIFETFIANLFGVQQALELLRQQISQEDTIFEFKKWFVLRRARRRLTQKEPLENSFTELDHWLNQALNRQFVSQSLIGSPSQLNEKTNPTEDKELAVAQLATYYLANPEQYATEIEKLTQWCICALITPEGQASVRDWVSFRLPQRTDFHHLVPTVSVPNETFNKMEGPYSTRRQREGFKLTDLRMSTRQIQDEINYCLYCHAQENDLCSKGFLRKKGKPEQGFKIDLLGNTLTGCPLDEKISEMHWLKQKGYPIAALAVVMIDNPMCPVTGHRICNDCMKSCIYQKQTPVNIPQIETHILTDVLELPWGVEIYDLLTRWNPLRPTQWIPKPYNGLKVLIAGQGPAGFTLAHHLLMEGFAVVGIDGLKIEPLPDHLLNTPVLDYASLAEELDERVITGFGGVAEYGITARWDKNFLKLIYLSLSRRPYFQVYGNVRFGGTVTVEDAWQLGFDHVAIAVGAGLPQALSIEGSLAPGMRQATDFLMSLQLTGAIKENTLTHLQIRLPAIVIGGGLTGIDAATELQAYYLVQIEKISHRYEQLTRTFGEARVREQLDAYSREVLCEVLTHARTLREERERASLMGTEPNIQGLLHRWGGVTLVYRRGLQESPAYKGNPEEVIKALEEGIFYAEGLEPKTARLDKHGHIQFLVCRKRVRDAENQWQPTDEEVVLPTRTILVATGAKPNVAYEFEHRGHFERDGLFQYQPYHDIAGQLQAVSSPSHCKVKDFGPFTSYEQDYHRVTFLGDTHPAFHGSVVKAIASGKQTYPHIVKSLAARIYQVGDETEYLTFYAKIQDLLQAKLERIQRLSPTVIELKIRAPMAARKFRPGQFFRLQNFETLAPVIGHTRLQTEAMAIHCTGADPEKGYLFLVVLEKDASSRLCATFQPGDLLALMGPTGISISIPKGGETVMIVGGRLGAALVQAIGPKMRAAGNRVLYIARFQSADEVYSQNALESATDTIVWVTTYGEPVPTHRPQDWAASGDFLEVLMDYAQGQSSQAAPAISLSEVTRILVFGSTDLTRLMQMVKAGPLHQYLNHSPPLTTTVYNQMQCMLKGVCAQCLQWQIDPKSGQRTKAVFACSWPYQPLDIIDIDNLDERLKQNRLQEQLSNLWLDYLFNHYDIKRV